MDLTDDVTLIEKCVSAQLPADCNYGCQWRKGSGNTTLPTTPVVVQPTGFCKSITAVVTGMDSCVLNTDSATCVTPCQWTDNAAVPVVDPVNPPTTDPVVPAPTGPTPLFTKEFCHPREIDEGKVEQEFAECLQRTSATCDGSCVWGNGEALIPDHDFCAPEMLTDDVKIIESCVNNQ